MGRLMVGAVSILKAAAVAYFIHLERLRIGPPTAGPVPCGEFFRAPSNGRSDKNLHFKSARLTPSCRVTWAWCGKVNCVQSADNGTANGDINICNIFCFMDRAFS